MIEIGGRPILWHIMNIYTALRGTDFVICLGYRGYMIKEYFANYVMHESDLTVDARNRRDHLPHELCRTLARDAGRYRRRHHDRRPAEARRAAISIRTKASA